MGKKTVVIFSSLSFFLLGLRCQAQHAYPAFQNLPYPVADSRFQWHLYPIHYGPFVEPAQSVLGYNDVAQQARTFTKSVEFSPQDKGYTYLRGLGWYKVYPTAVPFDVAKALCVADGATMIVLNSASEAAHMINMLGAHSSLRGWVGVRDTATEGTFLTIFGDPISTTYVQWVPNPPVNSASLDCVYMNAGTSGMVVGDCTFQPSATVCEI